MAQQIKILYRNILENSTVTVTSENSSFPKYRLYDRDIGRLFKGNSTPANFYVILNLGANFGLRARDFTVAAALGSKIYVGTGLDVSNKKDWWEYNPSTDAWTQKTDFGGTAREFAVAAALGSKIYVGTGGNGSNKKDWWEYNPSTDAWTQKTDFGGTARYLAVAAALGSKIYVGIGFDGSSKKDWWEYNPSTDAWTQKTDFGGTARYYAVAAALGSKIYVGTGYDGSSKKDWWEYNPSTDAWTQKTDFGGTARYGAVAAALGSKIYVGTGYDGSSKKDWWEYNPSTDAWTQKTDFGGTARYGAVAAALGSKIYVGTGYDGSSKKDWWEYNPSTDAWTQKDLLCKVNRLIIPKNHNLNGLALKLQYSKDNFGSDINDAISWTQTDNDLIDQFFEDQIVPDWRLNIANPIAAPELSEMFLGSDYTFTVNPVIGAREGRKRNELNEETQSGLDRGVIFGDPKETRVYDFVDFDASQKAEFKALETLCGGVKSFWVEDHLGNVMFIKKINEEDFGYDFDDPLYSTRWELRQVLGRQW